MEILIGQLSQKFLKYQLNEENSHNTIKILINSPNS